MMEQQKTLDKPKVKYSYGAYNKYNFEEIEILLNRKLFLKWSKEGYLAGAKGVSFNKIKKLVDKDLFKLNKKTKENG